MAYTALKISGNDAIRVLHEHRSRFPETGLFPFLIGPAKNLEWIQGAARSSQQDTASIIEASRDVKLSDWIAERRKELEEYEWSPEDVLGDWPSEIEDKGSIGAHKDLISKNIFPEVYLGLANVEQPWQLPAALQCGGWNDCPEAEVQCAFHRHWYDRYGAEITSVAGDVVECVVARPPTDRAAAIALAWEQFWYCNDIVDQGCGSVSNLAAILLNSPYWYFWWD